MSHFPLNGTPKHHAMHEQYRITYTIVTVAARRAIGNGCIRR